MLLLPKKLCIYFGYPSLINGSNGNINLAVNTFKQYDQVVLGSGLIQTSHSDHVNTENIIKHPDMINVQVFGEISSTISLSDIKKRIDRWKTMGAKGIYANTFGYDFNVTRSKQNSILDYIHSNNLIAFVNAWDPNHVFSNASHLTYNPDCISTTINANDWYLATSYQIINGNYQEVNDWKNKSDKMIQYRTQFGTKMACVTTYDNTPFNQLKMDYAYFSTILYGFDSFGWGEFNFSAVSTLLPFRLRKEFYGTKHDGEIIVTGDDHERRVNIGIHLDSVNHTVSTLLD